MYLFIFSIFCMGANTSILNRRICTRPYFSVKMFKPKLLVRVKYRIFQALMAQSHGGCFIYIFNLFDVRTRRQVVISAALPFIWNEDGFKPTPVNMFTQHRKTNWIRDFRRVITAGSQRFQIDKINYVFGLNQRQKRFTHFGRRGRDWQTWRLNGSTCGNINESFVENAYKKHTKIKKNNNNKRKKK